MGDLPLVDDELKIASGEEKPVDTDFEMKSQVKQLVTADGTYATQSAFSSGTKKTTSTEKPTLRKFLLDGDFFVAASLGTVLCKLAFRYQQVEKDQRRVSTFAAEAMFVLACVVHLGKSGLPKTAITEDDLDRLSVCLRLLSDRFPLATEIFLETCRQSLDAMLEAKRTEELEFQKSADKKPSVETDDPIGFTQLAAKLELGGAGGGAENLFDLSLSQALGVNQKEKKFDLSTSKLGKVTQLSGFSDPVYSEAYVNVNQYDIVLDVLIVNQTNDTLENLSLELATLGDLKLVEKPSPITIAPHDFANIKASVKVASTENGIIFGTIVYDVRGATGDRNCVYLNDVHVDIMDYIVPASCTDQEFRQMWAEFEWENKVRSKLTFKAVYTNVLPRTLRAYYAYVSISCCKFICCLS